MNEIELIEKLNLIWERYYGTSEEIQRLRNEITPLEEAMKLESLLYELNGGNHGQKVLRTTTASHTE